MDDSKSLASAPSSRSVKVSMVDCQSAGGGSTSPRERMNEPVEVFEVTEEEWNRIAQLQLDKLGLTKEELTAKHDLGTMDHREFKAWMIVSASTL
jgi:hypothetical protein